MKKLLKRITPRFLYNIFLRKKYGAIYKSNHVENINAGRIALLKYQSGEQEFLLRRYLDDIYGGTFYVMVHRVYFHPAAILRIPSELKEYLQVIGPKSRNMLKKAERAGILCRLFNWNDHLDEIFEINTSSEIRQGRKMTKNYRKYPRRVTIGQDSNFDIAHIGAFVSQGLVAYAELYSYGNFSMVNRILGHKEFLKFGVMNALIMACVEYCIDHHVDYLNYLMMQDKDQDSLSAFKYRVGFRQYSIVADK